MAGERALINRRVRAAPEARFSILRAKAAAGQDCAHQEGAAKARASKRARKHEIETKRLRFLENAIRFDLPLAEFRRR